MQRNEPGCIPVPTRILTLLYEKTSGAFGPDRDAYGQGVEAEYQRPKKTPELARVHWEVKIRFGSPCIRERIFHGMCSFRGRRVIR